MSEHTPGPWQADAIGSDGSFEIWSTRDMPHNEWIICSRNGIEHRAPESRANAKLIAAAPDLLAALKEIAEGYRAPSPTPIQDIKEIARNAIAKATGEKS